MFTTIVTNHSTTPGIVSNHNPNPSCCRGRYICPKCQAMIQPEKPLAMPDTINSIVSNASTLARTTTSDGHGARLPETGHDYQRGHSGTGLTSQEMLAKIGLSPTPVEVEEEMDQENRRRLGMYDDGPLPLPGMSSEWR